jgi:hypothetical protein
MTSSASIRLQQSQSDLADSAGRAIKHAVTALKIADGDRADDGEDHLQAAVCRMALALAVREEAVVVGDE